MAPLSRFSQQALRFCALLRYRLPFRSFSSITINASRTNVAMPFKQPATSRKFSIATVTTSTAAAATIIASNSSDSAQVPSEEVHQIREILDFWLMPLHDPNYGEMRKMWFISTPELDEEIRERWEALFERAIAGQLDYWMKSADGSLALLILCDQFSRNMYRKSAKAFSADEKALEVARHALACGYPQAFPASVRMFFYLPFEHSENMADQELSLVLFESLGHPEGLKYAVSHHETIARFGRFPHRNEVLGRESTPEELEYLRSANRYGQ